MILPVAGPAQREAICFFEYVSINNLNKYHPCELWRKTLMFFSQTVPSVRYASIALALMQRNYLDRDSSDRLHQPESFKAWLSNNDPLLHYNRAIHLLLNQGGGNSTETTAITLLVCYLFTCFDHLAGNYIQAIKHLRGGVELSRNIDKAILNNGTYDDAKPSGVGTLICQVTKQIRRLDLQAVTHLIDWTPSHIQETLVSQLPSSGIAFRSLDQSADDLLILVARVMGLRNAQQQSFPMGRMPLTLSSVEEIVRGQLETWSSLFEKMLQQGSVYETDSEIHSFIPLLCLQYIIAWILLINFGSGREMDYDNFLAHFQQCVALAGDVATAHERYSGSLPTLTPEIGIVPVLYIIGAKCRHPGVRREVLSILRRQMIREAVWDSILAARVVERIIKIEEGGYEDGESTQNMGQIAMSQRIETLSWVHVNEQSAARLDITYTFCAQEEIHVESLMI